MSLLVTISTELNCQKMKQGIQFKNNIESVNTAQEIVYYGWDFSRFKITDGSKINQGQLLYQTYIPAWIGLLNERYNATKVSKHLKKRVKENFWAIQNLVKIINPDELVQFQSFELPIDSIKNLIKSYDLPEKEGIGFVLILESYNEPEKYVTGFVTFFDIENREILWATKMRGLPGSKWGFTKYVYEAFVEIYDYWLRKYYPPKN